MTADEIAELARGTADPALAARYWETHRMAVLIASGDWEGAARLVAFDWPEPLNDPEWNR